MSLDLRLRAYAPNGDALGVLPAPESYDCSVVYGDVGALSLKYPQGGPKASLLAQPCEVALEVSYDDGLTWTEPDDGRFLRLRRAGDPLDAPGVVEYGGPSYVWRLSKAKVLPEGQLNAEGKRAFLTDTAGAIMRTLAQEAQTRGALAGMDFTTFTASTDSSGAVWTKVVTIYYEPGVDLLTVLLNLQEQGMVDFTMRGRSLRLYNPDTVMAGASGAVLQRGRDLTEAPYQATLEGVAGFAYLQGDGGVSFSRTNPEASQPWGRWETYISQGGVSDAGTMTVLTDATLSLAAAERVENTYGLVFAAAPYLPFRDYRLGQTIGVRTGLGVPDQLRLRQITLSRDADGVVGGNVVLNDRFLENEVRQNRRVQGITGGATSDGGSGARPADGLDRTTPLAPVGLALSGNAYLDDAGKVYATITADWDAVTVNTDGTATTDLAGYDVFRRFPGEATWTYVASTDAGVEALTFGGLQPNTTYQVAVRAFDESGHKSVLSAAESVLTPTDSTVPAQPSAPLVRVYLGQLLITWDGLTSGGGTMPTDFRRVEVHLGTAPAFTPSAATLVDTITSRAGGSTVATGLAYGTTYYARLVAYDNAGNVSAVSAATAGTPVKATSGDVVSITADQITAGAITAAITVSGRIATALTGQRVEMTSTGIRQYDAAGVLAVDIAPTGSTFSGTFRTAPSGARTEVVQGANSQGVGQSVLRQYSGIAGEVYPTELTTGITGSGSTANAWVRIMPPSKTSGGQSNTRATLTLYSMDNDTGADVTVDGWNGSVYWRSSTPYGTHYYLDQGGLVGNAWLSISRYGSGGALLGTSPGSSAELRMTAQAKVTLMRLADSASQYITLENAGIFVNNNQAYMRMSTAGITVGGNLVQVATGAGNGLNLTDQYGTTRFGAGTDGTGSYVQSDVLYARTYTSAANVVVTAAGVLGRSTSSARYKVAVDRSWALRAPLEAVKALTPVTYYDKGEAERYAALVAESAGVEPYYPADHPSVVGEGLAAPVDADYPRQNLGLIAEDVEALGLEVLIGRDMDDKPNAVHYERLAVALLPWLRELDRRLAMLEG